MRPGKQVDRIERLRAVEREHEVAIVASKALIDHLDHNPRLLAAAGLQRADLSAFQSRLEATYLIRLFAEFETGLRDYWKNGLNRDSWSPVRDMIDSLASRHRVSDAFRVSAHAVRKYRNALIHEEDAETNIVSLSRARRSLCRFTGFLAPDW
jgi:hypothetical protein